MKGKRNPTTRSNALCAALVFMFATPGAFAADEKGWYIGGSVGQSKASSGDIPATTSTVSVIWDNKRTGWKTFGGYQFSKSWAAELAYIDFGNFPFKTTVSGGAANVDFKVNGWNIAGVGILPVSDNFSLFGKIGAHRWNVDGTCTASGSITCLAPAGRSKSGTDLSYGVGLGYAFTKLTDLHFEWERFNNFGNPYTSGKGDADLLSIGIQYKFF